MIIVALKGGLGNQLFQYAYGRAVAAKTGEELALDTSWYTHDLLRTYMLDRFNIKARIATRWEIFLTKLFNKKNYLEGYWQNEKYFSEITETIRAELKLKYSLGTEAQKILAQIQATQSVSLHVRRGDYLLANNVAEYFMCDINYYRKAIEIIATEIPNPHFFIFSDDITWVKGNVPLSFPHTFVSKPEIKDEEELTLMSRCKAHILANSSFSWWGAWLDPNPTKLVICPTKWRSDIPASDVVPSTWRKI